MYEEYSSIRYFYEQHLREAKKRQKQNELMIAMRGEDQPASRQPQVSRFERLFRIITVRNAQQRQEATDVQRAPAH